VYFSQSDLLVRGEVQRADVTNSACEATFSGLLTRSPRRPAMTGFCDLPPSHRVGARIWIARIILSWGIVSGAVAFILQFASWTGFSPEHTF